MDPKAKVLEEVTAAYGPEAQRRLGRMTYRQLMVEAGAAGVYGRSRMTKGQLAAELGEFYRNQFAYLASDEELDRAVRMLAGLEERAPEWVGRYHSEDWHEGATTDSETRRAPSFYGLGEWDRTECWVCHPELAPTPEAASRAAAVAAEADRLAAEDAARLDRMFSR